MKPHSLCVSQLHAALTKYFSLPFFFDSPVAESFKTELRNSSNFKPGKSRKFTPRRLSKLTSALIDLLLRSMLKRLADTVVFDLVIACERMTDISEPSDASKQLTLFQKQLEDAISHLPRFEPDLLTEDIVNGGVVDSGRKRGASEEIDR